MRADAHPLRPHPVRAGTFYYRKHVVPTKTAAKTGAKAGGRKKAQ